MTGSMPSCIAMVAAARDERRTRARVQSVTLQASTAPRYRETISRISVGSAEAGGAISAVTAKVPDANIRSRWPPERTARTPTASAIFFFQAEDGIRAHCVTGVQTCALPI